MPHDSDKYKKSTSSKMSFSKIFAFELSLPLLNGVDITHLWLTGCIALMKKITFPGVITRLNVVFEHTQRYKMSGFPTLLPSLKHLYIGPPPHHKYPHRLVIDNFDMKKLPIGLETLELNFGNSMSLFLSVCETSVLRPSNRAVPSFMAQYMADEGCRLRFAQLQNYTPSLRHLAIKDYMEYTENTRIDTTYFLRESVPLKLETLDIPKVAFLEPKHMRMLPRTLRTLRCTLGGGSAIWSDYEGFERRANDEEIFPSSLTRLSLAEIPSPNVFYILPVENLVFLSVGFGDNPNGEGYASDDPYDGDGCSVDFLQEDINDDLEIWAILSSMSHLQELELKFMGEIGQKFASHLPGTNSTKSGSLHRLQIANSTIRESIVLHLPKSVTEFEVPQTKIIRDFSRIASFLGGDMDRLGLKTSAMAWPAQFKTLPFVSNGAILPQSLTTFSASEAISDEFLTNLPINLEHLELTDKNNSLMSFVSSSALPSYNFALIASQAILKSLTINGTISFEQLNLFKGHFPNLTSLSIELPSIPISGINEHQTPGFGSYGKALTDVSIHLSEFVLDSPNLQSLSVSQLPLSHTAFNPIKFFSKIPFLSYLKLKNARGEIGPEKDSKEEKSLLTPPSPFFGALPRGLTHLNISDVPINTNNLCNLPSARLLSLKLGFFNLAAPILDSTLQSIPRSVTSLSLIATPTGTLVPQFLTPQNETFDDQTPILVSPFGFFHYLPKSLCALKIRGPLPSSILKLISQHPLAQARRSPSPRTNGHKEWPIKKDEHGKEVSPRAKAGSTENATELEIPMDRAFTFMGDPSIERWALEWVKTCTLYLVPSKLHRESPRRYTNTPPK